MDDPGPSEQFSLRWNNFHNNLTTEFHALLQGEDLVDVTIAAGGKFVQAHKIVLSVCSPYFKELFKINPCKHPIVILQDVGYSALCGLLQFMYCGEVSVCQDELADFLKTAELLQVKGLTGNDSQEQTKSSINKRPLTPETKRKSKMPRRIILGNDHGEQDVKDKINKIIDNANPSLNFSSPVNNTSSLIVPKVEPVEYSEIEEIDTSADHSMISSGETSGSSAHNLPGHNIVSNISPVQEQLQDGTQAEELMGTFPDNKHYIRRTSKSNDDNPVRLQAKQWAHFIERIPSTTKVRPARRCRVCSAHNKRSETVYQCKKCCVPLHLDDCFKRFHTELHY